MVKFASTFGVMLFLMNFAIMFQDFDLKWQNVLPTLIFSILYISVIMMAIMEPVQDLKEMVEQDDEVEYEKIVVDDSL